MSQLKYFVDDTFRFKHRNNHKWLILLDYILPQADCIEFNIVKASPQLDKLILDWQEHFVDKGTRKDKIYSNGQFIRFRLADEIKQQIKTKQMNEWNNYGLEDMSFIKDDAEILATISHEHSIYVSMTMEQADKFNLLDFNFQKG